MKWIFYLSFLTLLMVSYGQSDSTSAVKADSLKTSRIDIKEIVRRQIELAKQKEKTSSSQQAIVADFVQPHKSEKPVINDSGYFGIDTNWIILGSFSIIVFSVVGLKRKKSGKNRAAPEPAVHPEVELKKNIQLMREEKFIKPIDPRLKIIRTNLFLNSRYLHKTEQDLNENARRLNIAKTEILLASKFHANELEVN